eukprot:scaffold3135_cov352-Prasinococcus_capsulatus_cf.AAC.8
MSPQGEDYVCSSPRTSRRVRRPGAVVERGGLPAHVTLPTATGERALRWCCGRSAALSVALPHSLRPLLLGRPLSELRELRGATATAHCELRRLESLRQQRTIALAPPPAAPGRSTESANRRAGGRSRMGLRMGDRGDGNTRTAGHHEWVRGFGRVRAVGSPPGMTARWGGHPERARACPCRSTAKICFRDAGPDLTDQGAPRHRL